MTSGFRQRLRFDAASGTLRDGDTRYVMLREDSLMGLFRRLPAPAREQALAAFAASVAEHGASSATRYFTEAADTEDLLATIASTASQLGWGVWRFSRAVNGALRLEVHNSPFAHAYGAAQEAVCAPIAGMFAAVASIALAAPAQVEEEVCATAGGGICRFSTRPRTA